MAPIAVFKSLGLLALASTVAAANHQVYPRVAYDGSAYYPSGTGGTGFRGPTGTAYSTGSISTPSVVLGGPNGPGGPIVSGGPGGVSSLVGPGGVIGSASPCAAQSTVTVGSGSTVTVTSAFTVTVTATVTKGGSGSSVVGISSIPSPTPPYSIPGASVLPIGGPTGGTTATASTPSGLPSGVPSGLPSASASAGHYKRDGKEIYGFEKVGRAERRVAEPWFA